MGPLRSTPPTTTSLHREVGVGISKAAVGDNESRWGCPCGGSQTSFAKTMVPSRLARTCPALPYGNHRSPHQAIRMWPPAPAPLPAQIHRCFQEPPFATPALSPPHTNNSCRLLRPYWVLPTCNLPPPILTPTSVLQERTLRFREVR